LGGLWTAILGMRYARGVGGRSASTGLWREAAESPKLGYRFLGCAACLLDWRRLIDSIQVMNMGPWMAIHLRKTDATRRFYEEPSMSVTFF
jgi:hypothetical protein